MKLIITQSDLHHALKLVGKAVGSARMHPILCNVLLSADSSGLTVTCYNIDMGIKHKAIALVDKPGSTTVPYKLMFEIVSKIEKQAAIDIEIKDDQLILKTPCGRYRLATASAEDFPDLPVIDSESSVDLSISDSLKAVVSCCSSDESKQVLTGVHVKAANGALTLESTDGHRLSVRKQSCDANSIDVVIPAKTLQQVLRIDSPQISISFDKYQASIAVDSSTTIIGRVLDGTFPNVDQLIPSEFQHTLVIERKRLLESLDRISIVCGDGNNIAKLKASEDLGSLLIEAESENSNGSETVFSTGSLPDVAFNVSYLIDGIKQFDSDEIEIKANGSTTPVVVKSRDNDENIYLVMPVQVRS